MEVKEITNTGSCIPKDNISFKQLYEKYYQTLKSFAYFYTGDANISEDLTQDVFFSVWEKREELIIRNSIKSYLMNSIRNRCLNYLSQNTTFLNIKRKAESLEIKIDNHTVFKSGLNQMMVEDINDIVEKTLSKFPKKTRNIFIIRQKDIMNNKEIAEVYNISEKAVEYHITKALKSLRRSLKSYLEN